LSKTLTFPKPPLTLINPSATDDRPLRKLGPHGAALWDAVTTEYRIEDAGGIEILMQACLAADRVSPLAERISTEGEIIHGQTGPRAHPGIKDEIALRSFIVRMLEKLDLNTETLRPAAGRPPGARHGYQTDNDKPRAPPYDRRRSAGAVHQAGGRAAPLA
jgi:hypothetical protein